MLRRIVFMLAMLAATLGTGPLVAAELEVQKVSDDVYALVGAISQRDAENLGNNATFGLVVTKEGAVLIDAGGSYKGAQQIHRAIKSITDKPVKIVINTGGQDHRWLGNDYFRQQGARIIASKAAVADQKKRVNDQLSTLDRLVGEKGMAGTQPAYADETFDTRHELTLGGTQFQLLHPGMAHTPGDTYVWLPEQKVVFSGDIVYVERILSVSSVSKSKSWVEAFEAMATLQPEHVVPGHGHATDLERARADTYDYLVTLREGAAALIENGMGLESVNMINQSKFSYLKFFDDLKGPNAHAVYREMEWE